MGRSRRGAAWRKGLASRVSALLIGAGLALAVLARGGVFPAVGAAGFLLAWAGLAATSAWRSRTGEPEALVLPAWAAVPAGLCLFVLFQALPMPSGLIETLSPERARIAASAPSGPPGAWLPSSLAPAATIDGFLLLTGALGLLLLVYNVCRTRARIERLLLLFPILGTALALWGLGTAGAGAPDYLFVNRNHYAAFLVISSMPTAGFLAYQLLNELARSRRTFATWLEQVSWSQAALLLGLVWAVVLQAAGIVACGSRGGMLALGVGWLTLFAASLRFPRLAGSRWILGGLAGSVLGFFALTSYESAQQRLAAIFGRDMGVDWRLAVWSEAPSLLAKFPLTGSGWGSFDSALPAVQLAAHRWRFRHAESDFLEVLLETGPIGLALVLGGLAWLAWLSLKNWSPERPADVRHHRQAYLGMVRLGLLAGLAGFAAHSLVDFPGRLAGVLYAAAVAAGLLLAVDRTLARNSGTGRRWPELVLAPRPAAWALAGLALALAWPAQRAVRDVLSGTPLLLADLEVPESAKEDAFAWRLVRGKAAALHQRSVAIAPWRWTGFLALAEIHSEAAERLRRDGMDLELGAISPRPDRVRHWAEKAFKAALAALDLDPANPEAARAAAEASERLARLGPSEEAEARTRKLWAWAAERGRSYPAPQLRFGLWLLEHDEPEFADRQLSKALRLEFSYQAEIIQAYRRHGRLEAFVSRVAPAEDEHLVGHLAHKLNALGEHEASETLLLRSVEAVPPAESAYVRQLLARSYDRKGDYEQARSWFESALPHAEAGLAAEIHLILGRVLQHLDYLEEAALHLEDGIASRPGRFERDALIRLGAIYERLGRLDRALACYDSLAEQEGAEEWIRKGAALRQRIGKAQ